MPKSISICIPSHNCGLYLRATIESVLSLHPAADEIIISDDHSTDDSVAILRDYCNDPRLRILHQNTRLSLGGHYRFLLNSAGSDYVCFLSADDVLRKDFISTMRKALDDDVSFVIGACVEADGNLRAIRTRGTGYRPDMAPQVAFAYMATANNYTMSFALMRRDVLVGAPSLPQEADLATDWFWALWLSRFGTVKIVTRPVGYYRIHGGNAGHSNDNWGIAAKKIVAWLLPQLSESERHALAAGSAADNVGASLGSRLNAVEATIKDAVKRLHAMRYRFNIAAVRHRARARAINRVSHSTRAPRSD